MISGSIIPHYFNFNCMSRGLEVVCMGDNLDITLVTGCNILFAHACIIVILILIINPHDVYYIYSTAILIMKYRPS